MRSPPAHADAFVAVLAEAFCLLSRGVADRRSVVHSPTLASTDEDDLVLAKPALTRAHRRASRLR